MIEWLRLPSPRTGNLAIGVGTLALFANTIRADDASFSLEASSPQPYTAAYLGNGAIGLISTPLGTEAARSFLADVYDHTTGDVPRIASAPAWNEVDVYDGSNWLNARTSFDGIEQYRQTLDMYNGVIRTGFVWNDSGKRIRFQVEQFVARDLGGVAAVRAIVTPEFAGRISVRLPLRNWPPPHRYPLERIRNLTGEARTNQWAIWYAGHLDVSNFEIERRASGMLLSLLATAPGTGVKTGEAVAIDWTGNPEVETHRGSDSAEAELKLDVQPGKAYTFTKFVALVNSTAMSDRRMKAKQTALAARQGGFEGLLSASEDAWHRLWEPDIAIEGDAKLQRMIHSMLFYLLESTRADLDISTPPMGLSSGGYYGHIFWDADTFMFPPLVILHPELGRPMVAFRSRTREAARENAKKNGYQGAMYPWEAGPDGAETTPRFAFQNASSENHVNGDVALAAWQYWLATGDRKWLENDCWPILRDTADFWASRVNYNPQRQRYEISHVVAVNESEIGVSNDAYTNAVAQKNLELAITAARELKIEPHLKWREVAGKMYVPESDSSLLWYPLDRAYSAQQTRSAVDSSLREIHQHGAGAMMGVEFYSILAAEIGDKPAIPQLLGALSAPYLRPPFQVIAETPDNQNTNFITGAGAFLQQFVFGYTGLRLSEKGLEHKYAVTLPPGVHKIRLKNINVRGRRETLVFDSSAQ